MCIELDVEDLSSQIKRKIQLATVVAISLSKIQLNCKQFSLVKSISIDKIHQYSIIYQFNGNIQFNLTKIAINCIDIPVFNSLNCFETGFSK